MELVKKHGPRIIKTRGTVAYSEAEGWVTASTGTSFTILESMPREYVIEADVIREDGAGSISFFLPVEGKTLSAIVDIYDSKLTGLSDINDWNIQSRDNPTVHRGPVLKNGEPAKIRVVVSRQEISLYAEDDGSTAERRMRAVLLRLGLDRRISRETLPDVDWVAKSLEGLRPVRAGRFFVHGAHDRGGRRAGDIGIEIEAGLVIA